MELDQMLHVRVGIRIIRVAAQLTLSFSLHTNETLAYFIRKLYSPQQSKPLNHNRWKHILQIKNCQEGR